MVYADPFAFERIMIAIFVSVCIVSFPLIGGTTPLTRYPLKHICHAVKRIDVPLANLYAMALHTRPVTTYAPLAASRYGATLGRYACSSLAATLAR